MASLMELDDDDYMVKVRFHLNFPLDASDVGEWTAPREIEGHRHGDEYHIGWVCELDPVEEMEFIIYQADEVRLDPVNGPWQYVDWQIGAWFREYFIRPDEDDDEDDEWELEEDPWG